MSNIIPIFFSIDDAYAPFLSVALNSAIQNSSRDNQYKAIILHQNLSEKNKAKLAALAKDHFQIEFVAMQDGLESITDSISNRLRCDYFTLTIYFRLFIPAMFPQYDKAIYLDSDVVVLGDLRELFDTPLGSNLVAACPDRSVADVPELVNYMENAVGVAKDKYINSGVLLMNLAELRRVNFDKFFLELLNTYHFDSIAPDQDYINAICCDRLLHLSDEWDIMPNPNTAPSQAAKLVHYNLFSKPWCYDGIQYEELFWKHAETCGYLDDIRRYKANYSDEQKQADSDCLELLINRGNTIPSQDITFKKLYESGVKIRL